MSARQPWAVELGTIHLRRAGPADRERVARFIAAMDRQGLYQRHFAHGDAPNQALLERLDAADGADRVVVLALGADGEALGHAEYVASDGRAEYALMVLSAVRGMGVGSRLLDALLELAQAAGQVEMHGIIQAGNTRALRVARSRGFRVVPGAEHGTVTVARALLPVFATLAATGFGLEQHSPSPISDDPHRTPLHRRPRPGTPLWPRGGQVQRVAADLVGGRQEA